MITPAPVFHRLGVGYWTCGRAMPDGTYLQGVGLTEREASDEFFNLYLAWRKNQ